MKQARRTRPDRPARAGGAASSEGSLDVADSAAKLGLTPVEAGTRLRTRAYEAIKKAIAEMDLYGGDEEIRLDERQLSERLGVSRTPVREALSILEQEGFVRSAPRRGVFVVRKSKAEIIEIITAWAALESMAARFAAERASRLDVARLTDIFRDFEGGPAPDRLDAYSDANIRFHQAIIRLGECRLIEAMTENLFIHARAIRAASIRQENRTERSMAEHRAIIAALEAGDPDLAERLVRDHALGLADHVRRHGSFP